jgi:hypothetical protein
VFGDVPEEHEFLQKNFQQLIITKVEDEEYDDEVDKNQDDDN